MNDFLFEYRVFRFVAQKELIFTFDCTFEIIWVQRNIKKNDYFTSKTIE